VRREAPLNKDILGDGQTVECPPSSSFLLLPSFLPSWEDGGRREEEEGRKKKKGRGRKEEEGGRRRKAGVHNSALIRPLEELLVVIASFFVFVFLPSFFLPSFEEGRGRREEEEGRSP
jgi:hypothetical protein